MSSGPFLTEKQLAERWGKHADTVRRWRREGFGPPFYKQAAVSGGPRLPLVRYYLADVLAYEETHGIIPLN